MKTKFGAPGVFAQRAADNSAIIEGIIAGVPHIFFDVTSWHDHLFYKVLPKTVIAETEDDLRREVGKYLSNPTSFANQPQRTYLDWIDAFRDQAGHRRLGTLIGLLLDGLDRHGDAMHAMPEVVSRYAAAFGGEKAVRIVKWPYPVARPLLEFLSDVGAHAPWHREPSNFIHH